MKMRRKGFLAALAGMVAAPVLGKVKSEAKFPRWFGLARLINYGVWPKYNSQAILWEAKAEDHAIVYWPDGRVGHMHDHYRGTKMPRSTLAALEYDVSHGFVVEIPACAAEAILKAKPKFPRFYAAAHPWAMSCIFFRADDHDTVVGVSRNSVGKIEELGVECTLWHLERDDYLKEITAAEAQALLKPQAVTIEDLDDLLMKDLDLLAVAANVRQPWPTKRYSNKELLRMFKPIPPRRC